ncbi:AMP-binding protein, partial [Parabacteroides sp.]
IQTLDNKLKYSSKDKAIIYQEQSLSYQELDYLSNTIAYHIRQRVNKNNPIGLQIERSLYIVPAILGILKAGCIYVPLDPHNPIERSKHMIEDANIQLIITNELSTSYSPVPFITLHELVQNVIPETKQKINWNIETPENIAYIIYTSGTTGKPKGVPITFAALEQMIKSIIRKETFDIQERNIVLQMASINFDSSIIEIFTT